MIILKKHIQMLNKIFFQINKWLKKWQSIPIVITLIAIAVSVFLFWLNNHNIKINTIRYLRDVNISNLKYAISTLKDLKNENKIIKYKIIDTEEIIILKMVQSWNDFEVNTYTLNFNHISKNYNKDMVSAYIHAIMRMKAVNNINSFIENLWLDKYKFALNNRDEINIAIATSQEDLYNWLKDVCNTLSAVIINNQHEFHSVLNKNDLDIIKEICENNLCGENIKKAMSGDCNNIYNSNIPFIVN